jgi:Holliday junction DNA helicase RuvA
MLERVRGTLVHVDVGAVVIEVGGLGLRVEVPGGAALELGEIGEEISLLTHLLFVGSQEPQPRLFGFRTPEGRALFHLLRGISGIGPGVALRILGAQPTPSGVASAIARGDTAGIKVKGVGPKLSKRIISELRDKVGDVVALAASPPLTASARNRRPRRASFGDPQVEDAFLALKTLEFEPARARSLLDAVVDELGAATADELVRAVLLRS